MQAIYLCKYVGSSGERVGSMNGDRLYDLNLCAVTQLSADYGIKDAYRLANRLVPADLQGVPCSRRLGVVRCATGITVGN